MQFFEVKAFIRKDLILEWRQLFTPGWKATQLFRWATSTPEMRKVFFPAMIGWFIMAGWLYSFLYRSSRIEDRISALHNN